jgi:prepilin peptidase CpaA
VVVRLFFRIDWERPGMSDLSIMAGLTFPLALLTAAWSDLRSFSIPNRLVLILLAGFAPAALLNSYGATEWLDHIGVALILFAAGAGLFAMGLWGGGDAKLLSAVGLWLGWQPLPRFLLVMSMTGGLLALLALAMRAVPAGRRHYLAAGQIPYGVAIAAAGLDAWLAAILQRL